MRPASVRDAALALAVMAAPGCDAGRSITPGALPEIVAAAVVASPGNVLSAVLTAQVRSADSVAVRYGIAGGPLNGVTPAYVLSGGDVTIPVLGLRPSTAYVVELLAYGDNSFVAKHSLEFQTGALPADMPSYVASGSDPSPGFVAFAAGMYGLVIDNTGRVVWYHRFPTGAGLNFMPQPNGRYVARPQPADPTQPAVWIEIDVLGNVTRTFGCARGLQPRFHDLIVEQNGGYWTMCDETRTMDLSLLGGVADARVTGTVVQHIGREGALLFEWSPFDHFQITDIPAENRSETTVNWTHGNAIDLDGDGNLYISFRSLNEITKIDTRTGAVVWRMGGLRNQFTFEGTALPAFSQQHGLRVTGPGRLLLLDNLGDPTGSWAERYEYDEHTMVARQVASYASVPMVTALLGGTTQELPGGRVLVAFGNGGRVEEYDLSGAVVWRIEGDPGYVFRGQRIHSLYLPGMAWSRLVF